ncbi:MAG: radical SAM family heme chaperone HemW [Clostridia bacterium]|nr:radical SAM family heme chaperone HemW [Clostridia bacterium]
MENLGIYIHIPFCVKKCAYCDFYSMCDLSLREDYANALISQITSFRAEAKNKIVDTIYIGGGTPSILSGDQILRILKAVRKIFKVSGDAEITLEANPGTLDPEKLVAYHEAGINRLSIGLQSADDKELSVLERIHTREEFEHSFLLARLEGFQNINVDIMYALPGQTEKTLSDTLDYVIGLDPDHISFYGLNIEPETPFGENEEIKRLLPSEDVQVEMYLNSAEKMEAAGFFQYEISNFAKPGFECRHNMRYWKLEEYLGFGPAAHSFFDGTRFSYAKKLKQFILLPCQRSNLIETQEKATVADSALEFVMLGFRLRAGIDVVEYGERFGDDFEARYGAKMQPFIEKEYIMKTKNGYRLSRRGLMVSNYILSEILDFSQDSE